MKKLFLILFLICLSSGARAESIYLQAPIQPDNPIYSFEAFSARYLELTSEKIQESPPVNIQETHYMIGSWRLTQNVADQLASEFPMVTITAKGVWPAGWVTKELPE